MPFLLGEPIGTHHDHCAGGIQPGHPAATFDEVSGNRDAASAAKVEHRGIARKQGEKSVEPRLFGQTLATITRPGAGMPLVYLEWC